MKVSVEIAKQQYGIQTFECTEQFQNMVGWRERFTEQGYSAYLSAGVPVVEGGEVILDAESISVIRVGKPGLGIVIFPLRQDSRRGAIGNSVSDLPAVLTTGDAEFIAQAKAQLPADLLVAAKELLAETRQLQPAGRLTEGRAKKFVNNPDNFVAFTVQPRRVAILVHVRASAASKSAKHVDVAQDRRPYVRFWIEHSSQIAEALDLIRGSFDRK